MDALEKNHDSSKDAENLHCIVCSKKVKNQSLPYNDIGWNQYELFNNLNLFHCSDCGFGFSFPELSEANLNKFYEREYRSKDSTFYEDFSKPPQTKSHLNGNIAGSRCFPQIVLARTFCDFKEGDHFIDIGPGIGGSYKMANALLNKPTLHAIEKSEGAKEFYKKYYRVLSHDSLKEFSNQGFKAKIILLSHSLEHFRLSDLDELFNQIASSMDKEGVLVIEVPHVDLRIHADIRGADTPHLIFFSIQSLKELLNKFNFDVLFIDTCGEEYITADQHPNDLNLSSSNIKKIIKKIYSKLPKYIQISLRSFDRKINSIKNNLQSKIFPKDVTTFPEHTYGGNRMCLRLVARMSDMINEKDA